MPPITGVLLDIDDTLVDTRGAFHAALGDIAQRYLDPGADPEAVTRFWRADRHDWYGAYTRGEMSYREQRHRRANDLHGAFGGPALDDAAYAQWNTVFEESFQNHWAAHGDAHDFLDALDQAQIPYGAVSNASVEYQTLKLRRAGLERVPMLVGVDTLGFGKPDPRVFHEGCRLLGSDPALTAYVGDDWLADAIGARDAGLTSVWLDRPHTRRVDLSQVDLDAPGVIRVEGLAQAAATVT